MASIYMCTNKWRFPGIYSKTKSAIPSHGSPDLSPCADRVSLELCITSFPFLCPSPCDSCPANSCLRSPARLEAAVPGSFAPVAAGQASAVGNSAAEQYQAVAVAEQLCNFVPG
jgi:hypothetical protein